MTLDPDKVHIIRSKPKHDSHADAISQFEGDFECFSNTYRCLVSLRGDPEPYPSVEHALQASKTDDMNLRDSIRQAKNAIEAKKVARAIKPTPEWRASSEKIAEALLRDKFRRNAKARETLLSTGHVKLIYTNTYGDSMWGVCGGKGENKLGKLLERVRADAHAGRDTEAWCAARFDLAPKLDVAIVFVVTKGGDVVAEPSFEGQPVIRMGKLKDNEVLMAHPSVSRSHALVVVDRTLGAFLVDLGGSNGSFVDGRVGGQALTFAKSKRTYTLKKVETELRETKKRELYASMSQPDAVLTQPEPDSTVYVGNLEPSVTEAELREFFDSCGDIVSVRIPHDKDSGKMRGIAFVAFTKHMGALKALALNMEDLNGKSVKVRRAEAKPESKSSNGAGSKSKSGATHGSTAASAPTHGSNGASSSGAVRAIVTESVLKETAAAVLRAAEASKAKVTAPSAAARNGDAIGSKRRRADDGDHGTSARPQEVNGRDRTKRGGRWGDSVASGSNREKRTRDFEVRDRAVCSDDRDASRAAKKSAGEHNEWGSKGYDGENEARGHDRSMARKSERDRRRRGDHSDGEDNGQRYRPCNGARSDRKGGDYGHARAKGGGRREREDSEDGNDAGRRKYARYDEDVEKHHARNRPWRDRESTERDLGRRRGGYEDGPRERRNHGHGTGRRQRDGYVCKENGRRGDRSLGDSRGRQRQEERSRRHGERPHSRSHSRDRRSRSRSRSRD